MEISFKLYRIIFCLAVFGLWAVDLYAQISPFDPQVSGEAEIIHEQVDCFTDRSLYITGEVICFTAWLHTEGIADSGDWSSVLYVELISADGEQVASGKFPLRALQSTGKIAVPEGILTGNYFLRCYTRWMRNRDPKSFTYIPLRIINPERPELSGESAVGSTGEQLWPRAERKGVLEFHEHNDSYKRGDTVSIGIRAGMNMEGHLDGCITVVPLEAKPLASVQINGPHSQSTGDFKLSFLPDLYGATISGSVFSRNAEKDSLADVRIHFTLMGDQSTYFVAQSDAYGKFSVTLPERMGIQELLVQPESENSERVEVRIDRDFDQRYLPLAFEPFRLSEAEESILSIMARKAQLSRIYGLSESVGEKRTDTVHVPFYGSPTFSLDMDEYVLLPNLKEVFISLVPGVTPVTRNNRDFLFIDSKNPSLNRLFYPLIMIDEVPLFDNTQFMSVPPEKISRIDLIDDVYLKGDVWFGGIINMHSKEKDIAGIDLPEDAFFFDFQAMYPEYPEEKLTVLNNDRIPDTRNTLLWMPDLQVQKAVPFRISFMAPDYPGNFVLLFRGMDGQGKLVSAETIIRVR